LAATVYARDCIESNGLSARTSGEIAAMAVHFFLGEPPLRWCGPEVLKMCKKTDFDAKTAEFDRRLLEFFEEWRTFVQQHRDEARLKSTNWLKVFCFYVRKSLVCFEKLGRLKGPLRP
jgi:hypothetical protein